MNREDPQGVISSDPEIMGGTPVFAGTRVPLQNLIDALDGGESIDEFLEAFPSVRRAQVIAAVEAGHTRCLTPEQAREFRLQLQRAREYALKDAEAFEGIIHVVERLGQFLTREVLALGKYKPAVSSVAAHSALATAIPAARRNVHVPFTLLYDMVAKGRNDALHIGAFARHLTTHAIELALVLEDALRMIKKPNMEETNYVSDYMVREPVCAQLWHPISFVRQRMLTNSFSFLPVKDAIGQWCLVSDLQIAEYLQGGSNNERKRRLAKTLDEALKEAPDIVLTPAEYLNDTVSIDRALKTFGVDGKPILVFANTNETEPVGILTAFDLL